MASLLLSSWLNAPATVGQYWVQRFINRHHELKSKYSCRYDHQQALCKDLKLIKEWFQRVLEAVQKYGITKQDIYNFDETGFSIGMISTAKVVTGSESRGQPKVI